MAAPTSPDAIRDVNTRYHDVAAESYDGKWGIDFDEAAQRFVLTKVRKALRDEPGTYARALEVGAGTGYFSLNLIRAGVVGHATCTDISPGMLSALRTNAERLGLDDAVRVQRADGESLPFEDASFDLVLGHAVLHHLPDLDAAFREFHRVLRPGGRVLFAGEPSRYGDKVAALPKRAAGLLAPVWRTALRAKPASHDHGGDERAAHDHALESQVDVHAFVPGELRGHIRRAGFRDVHVGGEDLAAMLFGWTNRALEASAEPTTVPDLWRWYAYHGYLNLQKVDRALLEPRLPAALFYNLLLSARKA